MIYHVTIELFIDINNNSVLTTNCDYDVIFYPLRLKLAVKHTTRCNNYFVLYGDIFCSDTQ